MWRARVSQEMLLGRREEQSFRKPQWLESREVYQPLTLPPHLFYFPLISFSFSSDITQSPK